MRRARDLNSSIADGERSDREALLKEILQAGPDMVSDGIQKQVVHQAVQVHQGLPGFLVAGVDALTGADRAEAFLDDILVDELEPLIRDTEQSGDLKDEQGLDPAILEDELRALQTVPPHTPAL